MMNILVIGNGGREHALVWKIRQSALCGNLFVAPGNAGTNAIAKNIAIAADDFDKLGSFCVEEKVELVVVGPEAPLVKGIRNYFASTPGLQHILLVGPDKAGAQLEGSKDFSKQFMLRHGIPTAKARTFDATSLVTAFDYIGECKPPIVIKADGLAAGKGVVICLTQGEARSVVEDMLVHKKYGAASDKLLIEEFLSGIELSVFVLTDGRNYVVLPEAKDYKRIGEGDTGPNTGGMGAVSPVAFADSDFMLKVHDKVIKPTIEGLQREGIDYRGFLFIGLMNVGGEPYVIEYNARMGDPETQAVVLRIKSDLVALLVAAAKQELQNTSIEIDPRHAVTVVLVSGGYPDEYQKGKTIAGVDNVDDVEVFHAGTRRHEGHVLTDGGRVLAVSALADTLEGARGEAYKAAAKICWEGLYFRKDIGNDLLNYKE